MQNINFKSKLAYILIVNFSLRLMFSLIIFENVGKNCINLINFLHCG